MKFKYLFMALAFVAFSANAQFTFQAENGDVYEDGDVYTTNSLVFTESSLDYRLYNTTSSEIFVKAEIMSVVGNSGADYEFCLGLCYVGVTQGQIFPPNGAPFAIDANGDIGTGNHIWYGSSTVDPATITELTVRYFQTTEDGNTQIGDDLTFIYKYDPDALGLNEVTALDFDITSTVISDNLEIRVAEDMQVTIFDLRGRTVKNEMINAGLQRINMSDLAAQAYIVQLKNNNNVSQTTRVIKK